MIIIGSEKKDSGVTFLVTFVLPLLIDDVSTPRGFIFFIVLLTMVIAVQSKQHNPGLADYILALRRFGCIQEPEKKKLEYLKEIGNKCAHDKGVEPNEAEVSELLDGAKWCIANIL